uniref:Sulfotransferase domain-containing protein n=1 Tax=Graphocephala atropunctata TaxID=36148 RepID=A0A1B6LQI8_9HEMI
MRTWTQEMVWLLKNDIDFDAAKSKYLYMRFPFLEYKALNAEGNSVPDTIHNVEMMTSPRLIKTHLPVELMPRQIWTKKPKIIYVSRNPYDAAISYFHHHRIWNNFQGSQELFLRAFVEDKVVYCPFWNHVKSYQRLSSYENILLITFEDMKKDLAKVMKEVGDFLDVTYSKEQEVALLEHLSFASMKNNSAVNFEADIREMQRPGDVRFMREGQVGLWKKVLSPEFTKLFEEWTSKYLSEADSQGISC